METEVVVLLSKHPPTSEQTAIAAEHGLRINSVGITHRVDADGVAYTYPVIEFSLLEE